MIAGTRIEVQFIDFRQFSNFFIDIIDQWNYYDGYYRGKEKIKSLFIILEIITGIVLSEGAFEIRLGHLIY